MDRESKRIDIAIEAIKQQVTLSAAIIAATVTLSDKKVLLGIKLQIAMAPFFLSVCCGVIVLLAIPYALYGKEDPFRKPGVRLAGALQAIFFLIGLGLMLYLVSS